MRLWHKALIPYLPKQQLLGQWRELNSIYKRQNKHILINFIYKYDKVVLYVYSALVIDEMEKRHYKINLDNFFEYFKDIDDCIKFDFDEIYRYKMDDRYLIQCLYNLQEKYDCGGITQQEWDIIEQKFKNYL